jgi:membrane-associated phospholipid phosphatase
MSEPAGDQKLGNPTSTGRPMVDMDFPFNPGNPYDPPGTAGDSRNQVGFTTFGPIHLLQVLIEVAGRAGRAVWWQKWGVHRRLRPEEYGGRVDNALNDRRTYPFSANIRHSLTSGGLSPYFPERYGSYLLPQAYPEGAPTHPAYGSGHAAIAGACATILKAFFDERAPIENPMVANAQGTALVAYGGADAAQLTVGGELNKLAGNISLFRVAAGVHWRSDYTESVPLGEKVAIGLLQEMSRTFNEDDAFFQLTRFDGTTVRIFDGCVEPVPAP